MVKFEDRRLTGSSSSGSGNGNGNANGNANAAPRTTLLSHHLSQPLSATSATTTTVSTALVAAHSANRHGDDAAANHHNHRRDRDRDRDHRESDRGDRRRQGTPGSGSSVTSQEGQQRLGGSRTRSSSPGAHRPVDPYFNQAQQKQQHRQRPNQKQQQQQQQQARGRGASSGPASGHAGGNPWVREQELLRRYDRSDDGDYDDYDDDSFGPPPSDDGDDLPAGHSRPHPKQASTDGYARMYVRALTALLMIVDAWCVALRVPLTDGVCVAVRGMRARPCADRQTGRQTQACRREGRLADRPTDTQTDSQPPVRTGHAP
jgi:hypothetical protein